MNMNMNNESKSKNAQVWESERAEKVTIVHQYLHGEITNAEYVERMSAYPFEGGA